MNSATATTGPGCVGQFKVLKDMPRRDEALELLKRLHSLCKPIQKKYGWYLPELVEFFPKNEGLLGMNQNSGQKIFIRLRPHFDKNSFLPLEESLVGTLLHEFTHNLHGPHDKNFYEFLDKLQDEYDALRAGGYTGEGFLSDGKRLGVSHNLQAHLAKAKALEEAERRSKLAKIMGPAGGRTLGGTRAKMGKSPRELMAEAAERRQRDAKSCGHGEAVSDAAVQEEMDRAEDLSQAVSGIDLQDDLDIEPIGGEGSSKDNMQKIRSSSAGAESEDSDIEILAGPPVARPGASKPSEKIRALKAAQTSVRNPTAPSRDTSAHQSVLGKRVNPPSPTRSAPVPESRGKTVVPSRVITQTTKSNFWSCEVCTYENDKALALACEMCGSQRGGVAVGWDPNAYAEDVEAIGVTKNISTRDGWICHRCGGLTEHDYWTCRLCGILKLHS